MHFGRKRSTLGEIFPCECATLSLSKLKKISDFETGTVPWANASALHIVTPRDEPPPAVSVRSASIPPIIFYLIQFYECVI